MRKIALAAVGLIAVCIFAVWFYLLPRSEEVSFSSANIFLSGSLIVPSRKKPVAALVLIHGSGKEQRMLRLAKLLALHNFVVLTYDKRGVGKSDGIYEEAQNISAVNLDLLAQDAVAAAMLIAKDPRFKNLPVGFAGFSQAGWIAPIAAKKFSNTAFIVLLSGPVCTVSEELHFSNLAEKDPGFWQNHTLTEVDSYMKSVQYRADDVDPRQSLIDLNIPGLWIFGGNDNSIPVDLSISRLKELIQSGHSQFQFKIFEKDNHFTLDDPDAYKLMTQWITSTASKSN